MTGVFGAAQRARAQSFDATTLRQPTDLGMTWLVKAGDDPAYAQTDFDDSHWTVVDPSQPLTKYFPRERPSVLWYRLHVKVAPGQTGLALAEYNLADAFEIYANGQRLMANWVVAPRESYTYGARLLRAIPSQAIATGSLVIALRVHVSWLGSFSGFVPANLTLGTEDALSDHIWIEIIGQNALNWFYHLAGLGLGLIALALFAAQRRQREYLWIFLFFFVVAVNEALQSYLLFHNVPAWTAYVNGCFNIATLAFLTLMYLVFLRMVVPRWLQALLVLSAAGILLGSFQTASGAGSSIDALLSLVPELSILAAIIPVLLIAHWRRGNREAGILLVPAIAISLWVYVQVGVFFVEMIPGLATAAQRLFVAVLNWRVGPFTLGMNDLSSCLVVASLAIIIVLRSTRIARQQAQLETEMTAAREVQQLILPQAVESIPGFAVETAYQPAQQVGGDFFQILPAAEGSLLVVIGDVAGKGLPAAMLVSVLVADPPFADPPTC